MKISVFLYSKATDAGHAGAGRLFRQHHDPRLVLRECHHGHAQQRAHAWYPQQLAQHAVRLAPVQRDVELGSTWHHVELAEAHLLRAADDLGRVHVPLGDAEFGDAVGRTPLVSPTRFRGDDDPAGFQRAPGAGQGAHFVDRVVQAVEEDDDVEFFLEASDS